MMAGRRPAEGAVQILRILLVAVALLSLASLGYYGWSRDQELHLQANRQLDRMLDLTEQHAVSMFETDELILDWVNKTLGGQSDDELRLHEAEYHQTLAQMVAPLAQVGDVSVLSADGEALVSARRMPLPRPNNFSDREYFRALQATDQVYISRLMIGRLGGEPGFNLSRRRPLDREGHFRGIVVVGHRASYFNDYYASLRDRPGQRGIAITLVRADGELLARQPAPQPPRARSSDRFLRETAMAPLQGHYQSASQDGIGVVLIAYRRVDRWPIYITASESEAAVWRAWQRSIAGFLLFALPVAVGLIVLSVLALRSSRREAAAVAAMTEAVQRRTEIETAMRQAQKFEALGKLAGGVAHEFNNLLLVIGANAELLLRAPPDRLPALIETMRRAVQRGDALTRRLLSFAGGQGGIARRVDLADQLPRMIEILRTSLPSGLRIVLDCPAEIWPVLVDPGELELALLNLALNARDAMGAGGTIVIAARNQLGAEAAAPDPGQEPPDARHDDPRHDQVVLTVTDTGAGMDEATVARAFEPFFTTKGAGRGTGLGLSQVAAFAAQAGGRATIESLVGLGTTVSLILPRGPALPQRALPSPGDPPAPVSILLVEDTPHVAEVGAALLTEMGYRVTLAVDGVDALDQILREEADFQLVITDIVMPGAMSGIDLANALRRRRPDLPVLLTSGYAAPLEAEANELPILRKPFTRGDLVAAIDRLIGDRTQATAG